MMKSKKKIAIFLASLSLFATNAVHLNMPVVNALPNVDYTIKLEVPHGKTLDGAVYEVFLKYKIDEQGNLIDPLTNQKSQDVNEAGVTKPDFFTTAKKYGTITIGQNENKVTLQDPQDSTKNVKGIYVVKQKKRSPGYLLDKNTNGKYAEVEFPRMENGVPASDQTVTINLKGNPAQKTDFTLFVKKDEKGQALQGVEFKLSKIGTPKTIDDQNRVSEWNTIPDEQVATLTSGVDGKVKIEGGTQLAEGKYKLEETNAQEKGLGKIAPIIFIVSSDENNKMLIKFEEGTDSIYLHAPNEAENGETFSLFNYKDTLMNKKIILPDGSGVTEVSTNSETPYLYEVRYKFPADYKRFEKIDLSDIIPEKIKPLFAGTDGSGLQFEHKREMADYKLEYKKAIETSKIQVYYEKDGTAKEINVNDHFTGEYDKAKTELKLAFTKGQITALGDLVGQDVAPINDGTQRAKETGEIVVRFFAKVDGATVEDLQFEGGFEGFKNKATGTFNKNIAIGNQVSPNKEDLQKETNEVKNKPVRVKINALKIDSKEKSKKLDGATFKIYKRGGDTALTPYDATTEEFTTANDGQLDISKLPYYKEGYDLEETKAPDGYRKLGTKLQVDIDDITNFNVSGFATNHDLTKGDFNNGLNIENTKKGEEITSTGTLGTLAFAGVAGLGILASKLLKKKEEKDEE